MARPAPVKDSAMRNDKPWWEKVADYNDADQQDFLKGVFQGRLTYRPPLRGLTFIKGLGAGYQAREFAKPESWTGKKQDDRN